MRLVGFTTRRLMVLVALAAVAASAVAWMERRSARFRDLAIGHGMRWAESDPGPQADRHRALWAKYGAAVQRPWLPVEVDPAEPE